MYLKACVRVSLELRSLTTRRDSARLSSGVTGHYPCWKEIISISDDENIAEAIGQSTKFKIACPYISYS